MLSIIDNSATDFLNCNSYEVRGFINESIIRKSNFRNFTWGVGLNKDFNIEDIKKVEETLKNVNIKYSKMITDPILFRVAERIKAEKTLYDSVEIDETDQKKFDFILKL